MDEIVEILNRWEESLFPNFSVGSLYSKNPIAHKWKAPFRSLVLRESVFWRVHDLLSQAHELYHSHHVLGSRILIRSALETLAILIYLNRMMKRVIGDDLSFHEFSDSTSQLLLGSRDGTTQHQAISILTVLSHCEKQYPGIEKVYATLSECAHPNWEGICYGYGRVDHDNDEVNFSNNWEVMCGDSHKDLVLLVMRTFEAEYNDVWSGAFDALEIWIERNDAKLESTRSSS